ncbi:MAG: hypothetical protein ABR915_06830 [Thermoguttaceae bacterium]
MAFFLVTVIIPITLAVVILITVIESESLNNSSKKRRRRQVRRSEFLTLMKEGGATRTRGFERTFGNRRPGWRAGWGVCALAGGVFTMFVSPTEASLLGFIRPWSLAFGTAFLAAGAVWLFFCFDNPGEG